MIETITKLVELPAGVAGPDPVSFDVRCNLVRCSSGLVLVDSALPGTAADVEAAIARLGGSWSDVVAIVITHRHFDHVAGLAEIAAECPSAAVMAGAADASEVETAFGGTVQRVGEGDRVGDMTILETPGHTPGHISLLHEDASLVLLGDLVGVRDGHLDFGPPAFTADPARNRESLARVVDLGTDRIVFSHGPEIPKPKEAVSTLLATS